jgi:hypothetical protein
VITWVRVVLQLGEVAHGFTMLEHVLSNAIVPLAPPAEHFLHVRVVVRRRWHLHARVHFSKCRAAIAVQLTKCNCSSSAVRQLQFS